MRGFSERYTGSGSATSGVGDHRGGVWRLAGGYGVGPGLRSGPDSSPRAYNCPSPSNGGDTARNDSAGRDGGNLPGSHHTAVSLFRMWCDQKLCDVTIRCQSVGTCEERVQAHKVSRTMRVPPRASLKHDNIGTLIAVSRTYTIV